ncbi:MAG: acyltransferase [Chloroflexi bacterium]|nr:acyltransferase [Chloroflexota bacterium]
MHKNQNDVNPPRKQQWRGMTLAQYVERRNGIPLGDSNSLRNMLQRSFGAASFAGFWQYWNPIWGYGLGKYVYSPMHRVLPAAIALIMTFVVSGSIHDLVTMALRRSVTFLFTPWFFVLGVGVVLGRAVGMDLSSRSLWVRIGINSAYLVIGLAIAILAKRVLAIP